MDELIRVRAGTYNHPALSFDRDALKYRTNSAIDFLERVSNENDYTNLLVFSHYPSQIARNEALVSLHMRNYYGLQCQSAMVAIIMPWIHYYGLS